MAQYHVAAPKLAREFKEEFGELNARQIRCIVNFAKLARRSLRSNAAFNPCAELVFPGFKFQQFKMDKVYAYGKRQGQRIEGLRITDTKINEEVAADDEEDE